MLDRIVGGECREKIQRGLLDGGSTVSIGGEDPFSTAMSKDNAVEHLRLRHGSAGRKLPITAALENRFQSFAATPVQAFLGAVAVANLRRNGHDALRSVIGERNEDVDARRLGAE